MEKWAGIAQLVQRLATGCTVRRSNPGGGEILYGPGAHLAHPPGLFHGDKVAGAWR